MKHNPENNAKMKNLILAAMDRMDADELLDFFYEKCCSSREKDDVRDKMGSILNMEGFIVLKVDGIEKKSKLQDFVNTEIFPYYNEQRQQLFPI